MHPHPDDRAVAAILMALALCAATPARAAAPTAPTVRIAFEASDGSLTPYTFRAGYALMTLVVPRAQ